MSIIIKFIFYILFVNVSLFAYDDFIVDTHSSVSDKVKVTSKYIDKTLNNWLVFSDDNKTDLLEKEVNSVDSFYKNEKFIDETENSFVRLRIWRSYSSLENSRFNIGLRVHLALSKTRKNLKLFLEDINQDNFNNILLKDASSESSAIGLSYFTLGYYGIDSKYSLGIRGFYPYIKIRYKKIFKIKDWLIEPSQTFKYSTKTDFTEETNLYFDTKIDDLDMFRVQLSRGTSSDKKGMDYSMSFQYFYSPKKNTGVSLTQSFLGNTETINYVDTYNTELNWRQSIWKKWFFYEVRPGIDFKKSYDFKPNYKLMLLTDFYFR